MLLRFLLVGLCAHQAIAGKNKEKNDKPKKLNGKNKNGKGKGGSEATTFETTSEDITPEILEQATLSAFVHEETVEPLARSFSPPINRLQRTTDACTGVSCGANEECVLDEFEDAGYHCECVENYFFKNGVCKFETWLVEENIQSLSINVDVEMLREIGDTLKGTYYPEELFPAATYDITIVNNAQEVFADEFFNLFLRMKLLVQVLTDSDSERASFSSILTSESRLLTTYEYENQTIFDDLIDEEVWLLDVIECPYREEGTECGAYECRKTCESEAEDLGPYCTDLSVACVVGCSCETEFVRSNRDLNSTCRPIEHCPHNSCDIGYRFDWVLAGGYDDGTCIDINECAEDTPCDQEATCNNTMGSFTCTCNDGFYGDGVGNDTCFDVDECANYTLHGCDTNAFCTNFWGTHNCTCNIGYDDVGTALDGDCIDINECLIDNGGCDVNANCTNTDGSFECDCIAGWDGDGFSCSDRDECQLDIPCHAEATCNNTIGSFECDCNDGFTGTGLDCTDIDECATDFGGCDTNANCTNTYGSHYCTCLDGFRGNGTIGDCADIDECAEDTDGCHVDGFCTNFVPGFNCTCNDGYQGDGFNCADIDECATNYGGCSANAECTNFPGSHNCTCYDGFRGDGFDGNCADINECAEEIDLCHVNATCDNTFGDYNCTCVTGYRGSGFACAEINECLEGIDDCHTEANCTNTDGSFTCECNLGWSGNGTHCANIDECNSIDLPHNCHADATCTDTDGSFYCDCNWGYRDTGAGDATDCANIDECTDMIDVHDCDANAFCLDEVPGWNCTCKTGYSGNGTDGFCTDDDECTFVPAVCHADATCTNNPGSYSCACDDGFKGDGFVCDNINECAPVDPVHLHNCDDNATCADIYGSFNCTCNVGYDGNGVTCSDVDECDAAVLLFNHDCDVNAACTNNIGSYECDCNIGWRGDGMNGNCDNIDECVEDMPCSPQANCTDNPGSFTCECWIGFQDMGDGLVCEDIDECTANTYSCPTHATCSNTFGSYDCICNTGYEFNVDGDDCINIDECDRETDNCHEDARCHDNDGSFACECDTGYVDNPDNQNATQGTDCVDFDECSVSRTLTYNCHTEASCVNTKGSYICECNLGWVMIADNYTCVDVDECDLLIDHLDGADHDCSYDPEGICTNTDGSYECSCPQGMGGNGTLDDPCYETIVCTDPYHIIVPCANLDAYTTCESYLNYLPDVVPVTRSVFNRAMGVLTEDYRKETRLLAENWELKKNRMFPFLSPMNSKPTTTQAPTTTTTEAQTTEKTCIYGYNKKGECMSWFQYKKKKSRGRRDIEYQIQEGVYYRSIQDTATCLRGCVCDDGYATEDGGSCKALGDCECDLGYYHVNMTGCSNIDECAPIAENMDMIHNCTATQYCVDNDGSYTCPCLDGYMPNDDDTDCINIDECSLDISIHQCDINAFCTDLVPFWECTCKVGYEGNGTVGQCENIDECAKNTDSCDLNAECTDSVGSYVCRCSTGFTDDDNTPEPGFICVDVDECVAGTDDCDTNAECTNTFGGWNCTCNEGWDGPGNTCTNIDECLEDPCDENADCTDNDGSFTCACVTGFAQGARFGLPGDCLDIDECVSDTLQHDCDGNAGCTNTIGSYNCTCNLGWRDAVGFGVAGMNCDNVDECIDTDLPHDCHVQATCIDNQGSYECSCVEGWEGPGFIADGGCTDIDECSTGDHDCAVDADCTNTDGTFFCTCHDGFFDNQGDGTNCTDIDECADNTFICPDHSNCRNTYGDYECDCWELYIPAIVAKNGTCENIACDTYSHLCNANATCYEFANSTGETAYYDCECDDGYHTTVADFCYLSRYQETAFAEDFVSMYFDITTLDIEDRDDMIISSAWPDIAVPENFIVTIVDAWYTGTPTVYRYMANVYVPQGEDISTFKAGISGMRTIKWPEDGDWETFAGFRNSTPTEAAIDCPANEIFSECAEASCYTNCLGVQFEHNDTCNNPYGYVAPCDGPGGCICFDGYVRDTETGDCIAFENCPHNSCDSGYLYNYTAFACYDENECTSGSHNCHVEASCTNFPGSFNCTCDQGFSGDGVFDCEDINECDDSPCPAYSDCTNMYNGYTCACWSGFEGINAANFTRFGYLQECRNMACDGFACPANAHCVTDVDMDTQATSASCACDEWHMMTPAGECWPSAIPESIFMVVNDPGAPVTLASEQSYWLDEVFDGLSIDLLYLSQGDSALKNFSRSARSVDTTVTAVFEASDLASALAAGENFTVFGSDSNELWALAQTVDEIEALAEFDVSCGENEVFDECANSCWHTCQTKFEGSAQICEEVSRNYKHRQMRSCGTGSCICNSTAVSALEGSMDCILYDSCPHNFCADGLLYNYTSEVCEDLDECVLDEPCDANADCANTFGSFDCTCHTGYNGTGLDGFCREVDECTETPEVCDAVSEVCTNNPGSYVCSCADGFFDFNGVCTDIDECVLEEPCDNICTNTPGSYDCSCNVGYEFENATDHLSTCIDINECDVNTYNCTENSSCSNTIGSYECPCNVGFEEDGELCINIDECVTGDHLCVADSDCNDTIGWYECTCSTGYAGDGLVLCEDVDECDAPMNGTDVCPDALSTCINNVGSFTCECDLGYIISNDTITCLDVDECVAETHLCVAVTESCVNNVGSYDCDCTVGYHFDTDVNVCADINECGGVNDCTAITFANCSNTVGSYACFCPDGFGTNSSLPVNDPDMCFDIDECVDGLDDCIATADCINTDGGFDCVCSTGYTGDPYACENIDECDLGIATCQDNSACVDTIGSYICVCNEGYSANSDVCENIDECATPQNTTCQIDNWAYCLDTDGSYECHCPGGMSGGGVEDDPCYFPITCGRNEELNKCINDECFSTCDTTLNYLDDICNSNFNFTLRAQGQCKTGCLCADGFVRESLANDAPCVPHSDFYSECSCPVGYSYTVDVGCENVDECADGSDDCDAVTEVCRDTEGSFECDCASGWARVGDNTTCTNIDECSLGIDECGNKAICSDTAGSYDCPCEDGYQHVADTDERICEDIDECPTDPCQEYADCTNLPGTFMCFCKSGFVNQNDECKDIDECLSPSTFDCDINAACNNTIGSYDCYCNEGYSTEITAGMWGDVVVCNDIDECADETHDCGTDATCTNSDGSFECSCDAGYELDDSNNCVDIDECLDKPCGDNMDCTNLDGSYSCACMTGYEPVDVNNDLLGCQDMDECALGTSDCDITGANGDHTAECENNDGSYECLCPEGYGGNGTVSDPCISLARDECVLEEDNCSEFAECTDTFLAFECECIKGFQGDGVTCEDTDECEFDLCSVQAACNNTLGSFTCTCEAGWDGNGFVCENIDECPSNPCHQNATCTDTIGSFECECETGYTGDGLDCADINECMTMPCHEDGVCTNTDGSFICECALGYSGDGVDSCENIDECDTDPCSEFANCTDTIGSFECDCFDGFSGNGINCFDINECDAPDSCPNADDICINSIGSFECFCARDNFIHNENGTCVDINECEDGTFEEECNPDWELCVNTVGSFICQCKEGFGKTRSFSRGRVVFGSCVDVNECIKDPLICGGTGACNNTIGSYECDCFDGFEHQDDDEVCDDIDECVDDVCDGGLCLNTAGSYQCGCDAGYYFNNVTCVDLNECEDSFGCHESAICTNTEGSFDCSCPDGYETRIIELNRLVNTTICIEINECEDPLAHDCSDICTNTDGSYECSCPDGNFIGNGTIGNHCIEVQECATYEEFDVCGNVMCYDSCDGEFCQTVDGAYEYEDCEGGCICPEGSYRMFGSSDSPCVRIDECALECSIFEYEVGCGNHYDYHTCDTVNAGSAPIAGNSSAECDVMCMCDSAAGLVRSDSGFGATCVPESHCSVDTSDPHRFSFIWQMAELPAGVTVADKDSWSQLLIGFSPLVRSTYGVPGSLLDPYVVYNDVLPLEGGHYYIMMKLVLSNPVDIIRYSDGMLAEILAQFVDTGVLRTPDNEDVMAIANDLGTDFPCHAEECFPECPAGQIWVICANQACYDTCEGTIAGDDDTCPAVRWHNRQCKGACMCDDEHTYISDDDRTCVPKVDCKEILAECDDTQVFTANCTGVVDTCDTHIWQLDPVDFVCDYGCKCAEGLIFSNGTGSTCIAPEDCSIPECGVNEEFSQCTDSCYPLCKDDEPVCEESCITGCNCKEGFVRSSDDPSAECVKADTCHDYNVVECGVNETAVECFNDAFDTCESVRLDQARLSTGDICTGGCACKDGFVRLNSDILSPCVPRQDCFDVFTEWEKADFFYIFDKVPPSFDLENPYTWRDLMYKLRDSDKFADINVIDIQAKETSYFNEDNQYVTKDVYITHLHLVAEYIGSKIYSFIDDAEDVGFSGYDFIMEWDRDFEDIVEENGFELPCYNRDCDIENLGCHPKYEEVGCPADIGPTCNDSYTEILAERDQLWNELSGARLFGMDCADKDLQCVCKDGYYRENSDPFARCVKLSKCMGGCPRHAKFVDDMDYCVPTCDDPDGSKCVAEATLAISNFEDVADQLQIPGCECRNGYLKKDRSPFAECIDENECARVTPECGENSEWSWEAPGCFQSCKHPYAFSGDEDCHDRTLEMCVCKPGFVKEKRNKKSECIPIEDCFNCKKNSEQFSECKETCFHDCNTLTYSKDKLCMEEDSCRPGCECALGYVYRWGKRVVDGKKGKCVAISTCPKPKTEAVNFVNQQNTLPDEVDITDSSTWDSLLDGFNIEGLDIVDIIEVPDATGLSLENYGRYIMAVRKEVQRSVSYMIVLQAVVETEDNEEDPIEDKTADVLAAMEEYAAATGSSVIDNDDAGYDELIEALDVTVPDAPEPTAPPTPTRCTGNQTYNENLEGAFIWEGMYINQVKIGRGNETHSYWDPAFGGEVYHDEGDQLRMGCKKGYRNSIGKPFTAAKCLCAVNSCDWVLSKPLRCVSADTAPMPIWSGNKFNQVREVENGYIKMKARGISLLASKNWTDNGNIDYDAHPEYSDRTYWENANFTLFVFCPFNVKLGGADPGLGAMTFPDFYPAENSNDGRLWSFLSRPGVHLIKNSRPDPKKSVYFKGFIDRSVNVDEQGESATFETGKDKPTCETGILPGHHPNAIANLEDNFDVFEGGDFTNLDKYVRT